MGRDDDSHASDSFAETVADRFGVLPNFFCSAPAANGLIEELWGFARSAYLDSPLPSLFKERLFVHLSRFCEVRYCVVRHVGFLMGEGRPAGDAAAAPHTLQQALKLLRRPMPDAAALDQALLRLRAHGEAPAMALPETQEEADLFDALTVIFLAPQRSARARNAVRAKLGEKRYEILIAFLAFVRTAHYWTETHPELAYEPDMLACMDQHPELAALLLNTSEATDASAAVQLRKALGDLDRTQGALVESEAIKNRIIASTQDCLKVLDAEGRLVWLSGSARDALGCADLCELRGRIWPELWPPEQQGTVRAAVAAALDGQERRFSGWCPTPRGGTKFWDVIVAPIADAGGAAERILAVSRDMTEQRLAVEALRDSEARFAQFAASSSDGLWIRDAATLAMEYASPAIRSIYGVDPNDILGGVERWTALILPEDRDTALRHIEQARSGEPVVHEFRIVRPVDGEARWIRNTDFPLRDAQGGVQRIGGLAEDVTEARLAAERQQVLIRELQHRSRNLLGVVTALVKRTVGGGAVAEGLTTRLKALSRAQALLSQSGSDTVEVGALVAAELAAHSDGAAPRITVAGPKVLLTSQQVQNFALALHELTTNAVKYGALKGETGALSVTWSRIRDDRGREHLALSWVESGVTVPPETVTRRGYGRELIEQALAYALGGRTEFALGVDGVRCRIELPLA